MAASRPEEELYDLKTDPYELNNLAASPKYADKLARLRGKLNEWMHETGDDRDMGESSESLQFSLQHYEKTRPKTFARNLEELRANYQNLSEVEPILPDKPFTPTTF